LHIAHTQNGIANQRKVKEKEKGSKGQGRTFAFNRVPQVQIRR